MESCVVWIFLNDADLIASDGEGVAMHIVRVEPDGFEIILHGPTIRQFDPVVLTDER